VDHLIYFVLSDHFVAPFPVRVLLAVAVFQQVVIILSLPAA
jgi:hypothetical protein